VVDLDSRAVTERIALPDSPSGIAVSRAGNRLYVTCSAPESVVCVLDPADGRVMNRIAVGHTATSPILSPDERRLYVCNRFNHDISVIDLDDRHGNQACPGQSRTGRRGAHAGWATSPGGKPHLR
jgi:DNA-binding beta-propeller fold protein YncE